MGNLSPIDLDTAFGERLQVPGYFTLQRAGYPSERSLLGRAITHWYGHEPEGSQHWTSFKVLAQFKPPRRQNAIPGSMEMQLQQQLSSGHVIIAPALPLTVQSLDPCWQIDPQQIALSDHIRR